jgi:hypothetical protein
MAPLLTGFGSEDGILSHIVTPEGTFSQTVDPQFAILNAASS